MRNEIEITTGHRNRGGKLKKNPEFLVDEKNTLLPFLLTSLSNRSRNYIKGALKRGQITVDGAVCTDYAHALSPGTRIGVMLGQLTPEVKMSIPVIYEDDDIIVIDKPAGMLSVSTDKERENTAYHIVTEYMKSRPAPGRVFIVHRLDRDTSGVMLLAKNERVKQALQENWEDNAARRGYIAVVEGEVLPREGRISSWLKQTKTLLVYSSDKAGDGKQAITNYSVLQAAGGYSLLDISLETGRKNQIRVHMNDMGHPVVGDKKYGARTNPLKRLGLHAHKLTIKNPITSEEMTFESKMPKIFKKPFSL